MLNSISIKNLGNFDESDHTISLDKITLFVGPNNAGKSQAFAAINLIKTILIEQRVLFNNQFYNLRSFNDAVHLHQANREIELGVDFDNNGKKCRFNIKIDNRNRFDAYYYENNNLIENSGMSKQYDFQGDKIAPFQNVWYFTPIRISLPNVTNINPGGLAPYQPLYPSGQDVIQFLLERFNDRDPRWKEAEEWLAKIDPAMRTLKTPLRGTQTFAETVRLFGKEEVPINLSFQGTGIQNAATIISAVIFSPEGSTICIEEPENFLHPESQEVIADLFNYAITKNKQIIFSTHSWSLVLPYISDVGKGTKRGNGHIKADPNSFKMNTFGLSSGSDKVKPYDIKDKEWRQVREDFKVLWG